MERSEILATMGELKLYGMTAAYDEIIASAVKRQHEPQRVVGDLLAAEIAEKQARSIKYQITIAKLPLAKDVADFAFDGTPINETLVHDLAGGNFLAHQRNVDVYKRQARAGRAQRGSRLHRRGHRRAHRGSATGVGPGRCGPQSSQAAGQAPRSGPQPHAHKGRHGRSDHEAGAASLVAGAHPAATSQARGAQSVRWTLRHHRNQAGPEFRGG